MTIDEKFLKAGFRLFFRPNSILNSSNVKIDNPSTGFFDLGVVTALTPSFERNTIELKDTRGGTLTRVAREVTEINESYTGTFADFNRRNLLQVFGSGRLSARSQTEQLSLDFTSDAPVAATQNYGVVKENDVLFITYDTGDLDQIHLTGLTGASVYSLGPSQTNLLYSTIVWVANTHFELDSVLGTVKILSFPSGHNSETQAVTVIFACPAIPATTQDYWTLNPQSAGGIIEGKMNLELGWNGNTERLIRKADVALNVSSVDFTAEDYSTYQMEFAILNSGSIGAGVGKLFNI